MNVIIARHGDKTVVVETTTGTTLSEHLTMEDAAAAAHLFTPAQFEKLRAAQHEYGERKYHAEQEEKHGGSTPNGITKIRVFWDQSADGTSGWCYAIWVDGNHDANGIFRDSEHNGLMPSKPETLAWIRSLGVDDRTIINALRRVLTLPFSASVVEIDRTELPEPREIEPVRELRNIDILGANGIKVGTAKLWYANGQPESFIHGHRWVWRAGKPRACTRVENFHLLPGEDGGLCDVEGVGQ